MSRSGYSDDCEDVLMFGRWRGQVASSIRGKRGQAFLKEALAALDALPEKRLIINSLGSDSEGGYCTLGAVGRQRGIDMRGIDSEDYEIVSEMFDIAEPLAREIVYFNDEMMRGRSWGSWVLYGMRHQINGEWIDQRRFSWGETPAERWYRMRSWVASQIKPEAV